MLQRMAENLNDNLSTSRAVDLRGTKLFLAISVLAQFAIPSFANPMMWENAAFHLVDRYSPWGAESYGHAFFTLTLALVLLFSHRKSYMSLFALLITFLCYTVLVVSIATNPEAFSPLSTGSGNYTLFALIALAGVRWSFLVVGTNGTVA